VNFVFADDEFVVVMVAVIGSKDVSRSRGVSSVSTEDVSSVTAGRGVDHNPFLGKTSG
jgi:hypothetical protein